MAKFVAVCEEFGDPGNLLVYNPWDQTIGGSAGVPLCAGEIAWLPASTQVPFDPSLIDYELAGQMFAGGFFFMVPVWAACIGVKYLLSVLR